MKAYVAYTEVDATAQVIELNLVGACKRMTLEMSYEQAKELANKILSQVALQEELQVNNNN